MANNAYGYSEFNDFNRFENLDGIETKIVNHLVSSTSKHAKNFWKLLKYNDIYALNQPDLTEQEKWDLVYNDNGEITSKRVFFQPFVNNAWSEECCSVYIFVSDIIPTNHLASFVNVRVETVVHSKICAIAGDGDPILNPEANPNDSNAEGDVIVTFKNRATVLLKSVLAELNGLFLDGIGYLQFNAKDGLTGGVNMPQWINRSYYGHATTFTMALSGFSGSSNIGY